MAQSPTQGIMEEPSSELTFNVFSLNCWGLYISRHRKERFGYLAQYLRDQATAYNVVALQEVWIKSDYDSLRQKLSAVFPFSHYYRSGIIGSGLVVFSRHPISRVAFHRYALGGSPGRIWHGDWYAGKGIALAQVEVLPGCIVDVFITHTHANYGKGHQGYLAERISQLWEILQFVQVQSDPMALAVIAGDFNTEKHDLPYRLMKDSPLMDCHHQTIGYTSNTPENDYSSRRSTPTKIDYIFHLPRRGAICTDAAILHDRLLPGQHKSISDHQPLTASFKLEPSQFVPMVMRHDVWSPAMLERESLLESFVEIFTKHRRWVLYWQRAYTVINIVLTAIFIGLNIAMGILINAVDQSYFTVLALVLFGVTPVVLLLSILGLLYARFYLQEELLKIDAYLDEWNQWLSYNALQKSAKVQLIGAADDNNAAAAVAPVA